ncbi:MAG TPA: LysM peptidoglycan-binding domain-containing protein, partial [Povalibacter sp.]|nr:LysM peptidoglycan-binding domain-containing protein [Povalibacter sp.]
MAFDQGTNDFGPIAWDGSSLSWNFASQSGDSIVLRTRAVGSSTWQTTNLSGSGDLSVPLTVADNQIVEYEISYTGSGSASAYAYSRGTLNRSIATTASPVTVSVTQVPEQTTSVESIANVSSSGGAVTWTKELNGWFSTMAFRYQLPDESWSTLDPRSQGNGGYFVDTSQLPLGSYRYEILYWNGSVVPYAFASGVMSVGGSAQGGGLSITDHTRYSTEVTSSTSAGVPTQVQTLDRWGNVLSLTDAVGNTTNYRYNQLGAMIERQDPQVEVVDTAGGTVTTTLERPVTHNYYDLLGRLIATRDANGQLNQVSYNAAGQALQEIHADGGTKQYQYNAFGNQVQITDEMGYRTRNTFDNADRLTSVRRETAVGGFESGNAALVITDSYRYNRAGDRFRETNGAGEATRYYYDAYGNVAWRTNATTAQYSYDYWTYEYDGKGRKVLENTPDDVQSTWQYDYFGRLRSHVDQGGTEYHYEYNEAGSLTHQTSSQGQDLTYEYDEAGHLSRIIDEGVAVAGSDVVSSNRLTEYGYDLAGRHVIERTVVDGLLQQNSVISYDALGRTSKIEDTDYVVDYSYDAAGNRTRILSGYFNHNGYAAGDRQTQGLWYTYDGMNRVLISQGVKNTAGTIEITDTQGSELTYNDKGERTSARTYGKHIEVDTTFDSVSSSTTYSMRDGFFTEHYGYDGLGRLVSTDQDTPDITHDVETGETVQSTMLQRTDTRQYDAASREISDESYAVDHGAAIALTRTNRTTHYDLNGRADLQETRKNGLLQFRVIYSDPWHPLNHVSEGTVAVSSSTLTTYQSWHISSGVSGAKVAASLSEPGYYTIPEHWDGYGYDRSGNLRGYKVEVYRESDGKYQYATDYTLDYRAGESAQLIGEHAHSYTTVHNTGMPDDGSTTRTYNVNGELVQFSDSEDEEKNRYFANDAQGNALTVIQGNFDGEDGRLTVSQAFDNAVARTGNKVKAEYFFSVNGQQVGSFGQLVDQDGEFKANFDVNYTPISEGYPASVPSQVMVQSGDTLRSLAARVFGDASLWYVIAEANGLADPDAALEAGTQLRVPNQVLSLSNSASSFKPFDVASALGDTTPTQPIPPPREHGCGVAGQILVLAVAIIATVYTAGALSGLSATYGSTFAAGSAVLSGEAGFTLGTVAAAAAGGAVGSAVSQGVAIAVGQQNSFDWNSVGLSALGAGVTAGLGGSGLTESLRELGGDALSAATNNAITQGLGVLTDLQDSFSWRDVALSAVAAPVAAQAGIQAGRLTSRFGTSTAGFASQFAGGVSGSLVRAAFGGKVDTTTILVDAFGNALGNSIVDRMSPQPAMPAPRSPVDELQEVQITAQYMLGEVEVTPRLMLESPLDNNPNFLANLPMPTVELGSAPAPRISRQSRLDRDLMNYAIDGGIGTSSFNRPIENAFDAQLSDAQLFDPLAPKVVDLRPTRENAIAMGYEQRADYYSHVTAELRPWDPGSAARAKLAGNAIGSMLMNPLGAVGYLGTLAAGGSEDVAFRNAIIGGAGGDMILGLGAPLGVRGPAALVRSTELEIAAAAGT